MKGPLSSITSPPITTLDKPLSDNELTAYVRLKGMLREGPHAVRSLVARIQDQGLDAARLFQLAVATKQQVAQENHVPLPPLPTWSDVAPTTYLRATVNNFDRSTLMRKIPHIVHLGTDLREPISRTGIRYDLAKAQADGFDPKDLYEKAQIAHQLKEYTNPTPPYNEVDPNATR